MNLAAGEGNEDFYWRGFVSFLHRSHFVFALTAGFLANPVIVIFILFKFGSASKTSGFLELRG